MASFPAVVNLQKEDCHFQVKDLDPLMDEVHGLCSQDLFWCIGNVTGRIKDLGLELNRLETVQKKLTLRLERLKDNQIDAAIEKIAQIAHFIHLGDLTLLKFHSYIVEKDRQMKAHEKNPPPRSPSRKSASLSLPST